MINPFTAFLVATTFMLLTGALLGFIHSALPPMIDPFTAFLLSTVFMLLTGAVLGFIHSALPEPLQPAATDWRIGTLLVAGSSLLLASRGIRMVEWLPPISNGVGMLGLTLYWRAVRRYFGGPDTPAIFLPMVACVALIALLTFVVPRFDWRELIGSLCAAMVMVSAMAGLLRRGAEEAVISSRVLAAVFSISAAFFAVRGIVVFVHSTAEDSLLSPGNLLNFMTPLVMAMLPTVGTTTFVLLLFERIRRDLHRAAITDALTGLANRRTVSQRALERFAQAKAHLQPLSVAVIDVDHFKSINDRFGHEGGDLVLCAVARTLAAHVRGSQFVGRMGGEEFVAILEDANPEEAATAAERLRAAIERAPSAIADAAATVTVSIGVATMHPGDTSFAALFRRADRALYAAKAAGRNCVRFGASSD